MRSDNGRSGIFAKNHGRETMQRNGRQIEQSYLGWKFREFLRQRPDAPVSGGGALFVHAAEEGFGGNGG